MFLRILKAHHEALQGICSTMPWPVNLPVLYVGRQRQRLSQALIALNKAFLCIPPLTQLTNFSRSLAGKMPPSLHPLPHPTTPEALSCLVPNCLLWDWAL